MERKSLIFSAIIKEDDADDILNGGLESGSADYNGGANDAGNNANNQAANTDANTDNPDNANDETKVDSKDAEDDEEKAGDDLDIDASLNGVDDDNNDNNQNNDSNISSSSSGSDNNSEAEPVDKNTDIFSSLTAEEQAIKIREQKQQFFKLFLSCNDILDKVSNINTENTNIRIISKITKSLSSLKEYLNDYITYTFDHKSFIDNDIILDRFLLAFNTISSILDTIKIEDDNQNGSKKS